MPPQNWKCTHCLHPPTSNKIPYFCGNHWYCCRHCYDDELKNPHISHLLEPTHHQHDPNAKDKHPPKTKDVAFVGNYKGCPTPFRVRKRKILGTQV